jgi:hypothetical protein
MKKTIWFLLISAFLLIFATISTVQALDSLPTVSGIVYNGTEGGVLPEGLMLTLNIYTDGTLTGSYDTAADDDCKFTFEQVDLVSGDLVAAFTDYLNVIYTSASFTYDPEEEIPELSIAVYETTEDISSIVITQMTLMLSASDSQLHVGEYYLLGNLGDRTWVGSHDDALGMNTTTAFSLASEVESLWFNGLGLDERFFSVGNGIVDTAPVIPGNPSTDVFFSYDVPYSGSYEMIKTFNLPVENIEYLIAQDSGIALEGEGVTYSETIDTENESAILYISPGINAGQVLSLQIVEKPASSSGTSIGFEIGIGLAALALAGFGIFWVFNGKRKTTLPASAEQILQEIANLDDTYSAGNIKKIQYQKKRKALIEKIKRMT